MVVLSFAALRYGERPASEPERLAGDVWKKTKLAKLRQNIEYHTIADAEERKRTAEHNRWLRQLRESLVKEPA